ncbi:MAG: manganese efflux pump [Firmicutes bacterium]|nr:manganese efflux pump [Bacillota bacterium]
MKDLLITSFLLGIGLAMDAFSVSLASGLKEPDMSAGRSITISGTFGAFQFAMPLIGWLCVHTIASWFGWFEKLVPWIALALLGFIGVKMIIEGFKGGEDKSAGMTAGTLLVMGVATSIDALSVGFAIEHYGIKDAIISSVIIGIVTLLICLAGTYIGRKLGLKLAGKASVLGGIILIAIGIEIFVKGIF